MAGFQHTVRNDVATIFVYEEIGPFGVSAKDFADQLTGLGKVRRINVRINSIGGDVFDGLAMYNLLRASPAKIEVDIDGMAASAASVIAMAGNPIRIAANGFLLIHRPWTVIGGSADDFRRMADQLEVIGDKLVDTYASRRQIDRATVEAWVNAETMMPSNVALEARMVDEVTGEMAIAASLDLSGRRYLPAALRKLAYPVVGLPNGVGVAGRHRDRELELMRACFH